MICLGLVVVSAAGLSADELLRNDFTNDMVPWVPLPDQGSWILSDGALVIETIGEQREGVRRPSTYVLLENRVFLDMDLRLKAMSLEPEEWQWRDISIIFGYVDDLHYYYAHLSSLSDGTAHNIIMKVDGDNERNPRVTIQNEKKPPTRLTDGWHDVRVEHTVAGAIRVYIDDLNVPLMTATDTTYPVGSIGIGSFDDRAAFDDVVLNGEELNWIETELRLVANTPQLSHEMYHGLNYVTERSTDLNGWMELDNQVAGSSGVRQFTDSSYSGTGPAFYRVRLEGPGFFVEDVVE